MVAIDPVEVPYQLLPLVLADLGETGVGLNESHQVVLLLVLGQHPRDLLFLLTADPAGLPHRIVDEPGVDESLTGTGTIDRALREHAIKQILGLERNQSPLMS